MRSGFFLKFHWTTPWGQMEVENDILLHNLGPQNSSNILRSSQMMKMIGGVL